jgi:hypothetical protein
VTSVTKTPLRATKKNATRKAGATTTMRTAALPLDITPAGAGSDSPLERFVVKGQVRRVDGNPICGALVRAMDKDLRTEQVLGEAVTDVTGQYQITYVREQFRRADKRNADLRVAAVDRQGQEIASSPLIFNAQLIETVDLAAAEQPQELSEYERAIQELSPLPEDVPLHELTEEDVVFLANDTGIEAEDIRRLVDSARLSQQSGAPNGNGRLSANRGGRRADPSGGDLLWPAPAEPSRQPDCAPQPR